MNKSLWLLVRIVAILILVAAFLISCSKKKEEISSASGLLSNITMASAVDWQCKPFQPMTVYATDANGFYCSFKITNAPPKTQIKGEWVYVSGEAEAQIGKNSVIDELTITVEGTRYAFIPYLRPPVPGYKWPKGDYKIVLYVNDKEDANVPFAVK